jgi:RecB family exonuclease
MIITSPTALEEYDRCPLLHHFTRHLKLRSPTNPSALLGRIVHDVLERVARAHLALDKPRHFDAALAENLYNEEWQRHGAKGKELFTDGWSMVQTLCEKQGPVDPAQLFALEHPFELVIDDKVMLRERIDRVDRTEEMDEDTGELFVNLTVFDYKSTRQFLTTTDVRDSVQIASYAITAQHEIEPTATHIRSGYWMLRTGEPLLITHTALELDEWREYILVTAHQMEADTTWRPQLNVGCPYCPGQDQCPEYARALTGERKIIAESLEDLDAVSREREDINGILRILESRKKELTAAIKSFLEASGGRAEMGETLYSLSRRRGVSYPTAESLRIISEGTDLPFDDVVSEVCDVSTRKLNALLQRYGKERGIETTTLVRAALENVAERTATTALRPRKRRGKNKAS